MFTGIVEEVGEVTVVQDEGTGRHLTVRARMAPELKVDQSVAHDGVCLTVTAVDGDTYTVTAVEETLRRTTLGDRRPGDRINMERALRVGDRLDGHVVQGHVDTVTQCVGVHDRDGSHVLVFALPDDGALLVPKGGICLNGVSLTIAALDAQTFSVAVIPHTFARTNFHGIRPGSRVNVEYDVLGKYVRRLMEMKQ